MVLPVLLLLLLLLMLFYYFIYLFLVQISDFGLSVLVVTSPALYSPGLDHMAIAVLLISR